MHHASLVIYSSSLRLGPLERSLKETQIKYVEIENSVKGLSNIFDGVKESGEM